ncbi:hypothetical protein [Devosia sp.]|uniref:hypothetical protein n=1 Tax=Devosia sp. TaxID=1871048 RepID=UPI002AFF5470|nr:hypothetical protein [Devosia sp.]
MNEQSPSRRGIDWRLLAAILAAAVAILVVRTLMGRAGQPFFPDTDDAMRMVMVRDFLGGQNWYDLVAHRLNTPWGAELHWSRLVDLPLALLVMAFTPFLGPDMALVGAGYVWPLALLGALLFISAGLTQRLVGPEGVLPALVLPILSPAILAEFTPGRVDHHNVIIVLTLAMAWAAVESVRRPRAGIVCGLPAATALAIATESLPAIAAAILALGLLWVAEPIHARAMRGFGLAFGLGAMGHLALFRPPWRWLEPACDVISPVYVGVALVVALSFTLASLIRPPRAAWQRLVLLALLGGLGLGLILALYPQCLGGPYGALDPWLQSHWIAGIVEARPWLSTLVELPAYAIAVGVPALLAALVVIVRLARVKEGRAEWAVLLVFLLATALVMLTQVRGARLAIMPAMPAAAWLIVSLRRRYLARARLGNALALMLSWLAFSGVVLSLLVTGITLLAPGEKPASQAEGAGKQACLVAAAFADLAALPPERIMTPIDLGAHLMLYTPHEVVSAPYHRNQQGVRDTFRFFNEPIATARAILAERGIGLVVLCPGMAEVRGLPELAPDSFAALYAAGTLPDWLEDVSLPESALRIFSVLPGY